MRLLYLTWGRVVASLVLSLGCLQVLHMVLLSRLETRKTEHKQQQLKRQLQEDADSLFISMRERLESTRVLDSSGQYSIVTFLYKSSDHKRQSSARTQEKNKVTDVTLVSQCSVHLLHHLVELVEVWQGPLSVSVFASDTQAGTAVDILLKLYGCLPSFQKFVSIHLVTPLTPNRLLLPERQQEVAGTTCQFLHQKIIDLVNKRTLSFQNYALGKVQYPNNLLRNVAMKNVLTAYTMVIDIDMVPSPNLRDHLVHYLQSRRKQDYTQTSEHHTVFVVPAFEIQREVSLPRDKAQLLKLWDQHVVRPFYFEACWKCQRHTDYEAWRDLPSTSEDGHSGLNDLRVAFEVEWKDPWEPFFVGPRDMPMYDERFKQYGFNRISQVCELHIAGFKFAVLDKAFLIHRGLKTQESFHFSKDSEQEHNRLLFRQFKEELKTKYPESDKRCY